MLKLTLVLFVVCTLCRPSYSFNFLQKLNPTFEQDERQACPAAANCSGKTQCSSNSECPFGTRCCIDLFFSTTCCITPISSITTTTTANTAPTDAVAETCQPLNCSGQPSCSANQQCAPQKCCIDLTHSLACCFHSSLAVTTTTPAKTTTTTTPTKTTTATATTTPKTTTSPTVGYCNGLATPPSCKDSFNKKNTCTCSRQEECEPNEKCCIGNGNEYPACYLFNPPTTQNLDGFCFGLGYDPSCRDSFNENKCLCDTDSDCNSKEKCCIGNANQFAACYFRQQ